MSSPIHYRLHLGSENRQGDWHDDPATPKQMARLHYLGVAPHGSVTKGQAGAIIDRSELDPQLKQAVEQWHQDKYRLHPSLYPPPVREKEDARFWQGHFGPDGIYGLEFRRPTQLQIIQVLEHLDRTKLGWDQGHDQLRSEQQFMNELAGMFPALRKRHCSYPRANLPAQEVNPATPSSPPISAKGKTVPILVETRCDSPSRSPEMSPGGLFLTAVTPPSKRSFWPWVLVPLGMAALLILAVVATWSEHPKRQNVSVAPTIITPAPAPTAPPLRLMTPAATSVATVSPTSTPALKATAAVAAAPTSQVIPPFEPTYPERGSFQDKVAVAQRIAVMRYPDLGKAGTTLNRSFLREYDRLRVGGSDWLTDYQWPVWLARECDARIKNPRLGPIELRPRRHLDYADSFADAGYVPTAPVVAAPTATPYYPYPDSSTSDSSVGGPVYVHGYYRKDGTYVRSHTRSR